MRPTILLLAKAAIAAKPLAELKELAEAVERVLPCIDARFALSEQGHPSLRDQLTDLAEAQTPEVIIVPVMIPMEPGFPAWIKRAVHRWKLDWTGFVPVIRIAAPPALDSESLSNLIAGLAESANANDVAREKVKLPNASIIPGQKHRVLVCMGGACNDAGAGRLWSHLRSEQDRLKLRETGDGMMSCKTSCLGPCNLAPVLQVWPEGTTYCGVDEAALDQILRAHLQDGQPVAAFSYQSNGKKQKLQEKLLLGGKESA